MFQKVMLMTVVSLFGTAAAGGGNPTASALATAQQWDGAVRTALYNNDFRCRKTPASLDLQGTNYVFSGPDHFYFQSGDFIAFFSVEGGKLREVWEANLAPQAAKNTLRGEEYRAVIADNAYLQSIGLVKANFKSWCGSPPKQAGRLIRVDWNMGSWLPPKIITP